MGVYSVTVLSHISSLDSKIQFVNKKTIYFLHMISLISLRYNYCMTKLPLSEKLLNYILIFMGISLVLISIVDHYVVDYIDVEEYFYIYYHVGIAGGFLSLLLFILSILYLANKKILTFLVINIYISIFIISTIISLMFVDPMFFLD